MSIFLRAIAAAFFSELFAAIDNYLGRISQAQEQRRAGAAEAAATINKETSDAERRASEAQANAPKGSALDDDLKSGRVEF